MACLLLTSTVLALLRVSDPTARRLIELVALTPWGLPAAGLALLGCATPAIRRRQRAPFVAAATCLVVVHAWWLAPFYAGDRPAGQPGSLVVLAQNFEYGDVDELVELVQERNVGVLVLTDVSTERVDLLLEAGIATRLPHSAGLEERAVRGAVVLSRVPVVRTALVHEGAESRVVELRPQGWEPVTIVAVHTRPPYAPAGWREDHERLHAALTRLRSEEGSAVVLAGDFNATLAHAPVRRILALGFADAAVQSNIGWSPTWPSAGHQRLAGVAVPPYAAIDHVMTSPELVVTDAETIAVPAADHEAVLATIVRAG